MNPFVTESKLEIVRTRRIQPGKYELINSWGAALFIEEADMGEHRSVRVAIKSQHLSPSALWELAASFSDMAAFLEKGDAE